MRTDHTTYQLATRVAAVGFALQLIAGVVVLIYGMAAPDDLARTGAYSILLGLPIWAALIILFHQHKLERIEAIESQQLADEYEHSTAIFELEDEDLQIAARRLRLMYKYLLPVVSLIVAAGLMMVGYRQYKILTGKLNIEAASSAEATELMLASGKWAPWGLVLGAAIAVILFIFSRYVAGMSKQIAWRNLRGGATTSVGAALVSAIIGVAYGFLVKENEFLARQLATILPVYIVLTGIEIGVNFILNIYTPRRPGEYPRPAFDSRVLSLLAAPDTVVKSVSDAIDYQFGFQVTSTWFYRLISRQLLPLLGLGVVFLLLLNCIAIVNPSQQAVVVSYGQFARTNEQGIPKIYDSGPIVKWPWERVESYAVHLVHKTEVGLEAEHDNRPILWGKKHTTGTEDLVIVAPSAQEQAYTGESAVNPVAQNYSTLNLYMPVHFRVKSGTDTNGLPGLYNYIMFLEGGGPERSKFLQSMATRAVTDHLASMPIDQVLGPMRVQLATDLRHRIQNELDEAHTGIEVMFVGIAGIHPPMGTEGVKVAEAFEAVLQAQEEREKAIEIAKSLAISKLAQVAGTQQKAEQIASAIDRLNLLSSSGDEYEEQDKEIERLLLEAGGTAARMIQEARATRWNKHMVQWGKTIRHNSRLEPYNAAPRLYRHREYLYRLSQALKGQRLYIVGVPIPVHGTFLFQQDATMIRSDLGMEQYNEETGGGL